MFLCKRSFFSLNKYPNFHLFCASGALPSPLRTPSRRCTGGDPTPSSASDTVPLEWYKQAYPKLTKLNQILKNLDFIDGKLVNVNDDSAIYDERLLHRMRKFKALSRIFIDAPFTVQTVNHNIEAVMSGRRSRPCVCFGEPIEREPMIVDCLTKICDFLGMTPQQRTLVKNSIREQVTHYEIWTGALEFLLKELQMELGSLKDLCPSKNVAMSEQIVSACLKFLAETASSERSSWMRPKQKGVSAKWVEVVSLFGDLIEYLVNEGKLGLYVLKLEAMLEGLRHIHDICIYKDIAYKDALHQENLVRKQLMKRLGHPSRCLFTLLRYCLHGTISDLEVEVSGGLYELQGKRRLCLYMGKVVTSNEEWVVKRGVKQLDRALELFKLVWETAQMEGSLEVQGHLWCVGADHRTLTYRKNLYFIHGISV